MIKHQAPWKKLVKVVDRYMASMEPKNSRKHTDASKLFSQYSAITSDIKQVVTSKPEVTAIPVTEKVSSQFSKIMQCAIEVIYTCCFCKLRYVVQTNGKCYAQDHKQPVGIRNINLPKDFI